MKQITDRDGHPSVFRVDCGDGGLWLYGDVAHPAVLGTMTLGSCSVSAS
jgi:hypothetical protein